jgi:MFS family permease
MQERERPGLRRAVAALQHRDFRIFYVALLVAGIGGQLQTFASLLQIYELTGSPLHLGLTGLARALPVITLSLVGGVVADRVDRIRFSMACQGLTGLFSVALAVLTFVGTIDVWHIYLFTFLSGAAMALNHPSQSAIIPNLVPRHHLLNAVALNSTVRQSSVVIGPMLGGVAIAAFSTGESSANGFAPTYLLNGLAHLITVGTMALIHIPPVAARAGQSALQGLTEGLQFVRRRSIILVLLAADSAETLFGRYQAMLPIIAANVGAGAAGLGVLSAAPGAGSLFGAMLIMSLGDIRYKGLVVIGALLAYSASLVLLALSPWFALSLAATFLLGMFDSLQATPRNAVIQLVTPDELRGRVSSFQGMLTTGLPSLGQALLGALGAVIGVPTAMIAGATANAAVQIGLVTTRPELRAPDLGAVEPESPVPPLRGDATREGNPSAREA